jgi:hypothetical protein
MVLTSVLNIKTEVGGQAENSVCVIWTASKMVLRNASVPQIIWLAANELKTALVMLHKDCCSEADCSCRIPFGLVL